MKTRTGDELALDAMKKELVRLSNKAAKAKAESQECIGISSELINIHQEFAAIVRSGSTTAETLKKLEALKARNNRAENIMKKDLIAVLDRESAAEIERDALAREIQHLEFRASMRRRA